MICKLTTSSRSLARGQMGGGPFTYENVTGFERIAQELDGSLQQWGWRQETMVDPRETRERRMREEVMPQDHHLLPASFSPSVFFSFLWFFRLLLLLRLLPGRLSSPSLLLAVSPSLLRNRP